MDTNYTEENYYRAQKRVEAIKKFYGNLATYIVVNIGLLVVNLVTTPKHLWFYWPLLWWGMAVLFNGLKTFNYMPSFGKNWEEQKIKEFMNKETRK